jgi:hypothetical protein
VDLAFAVCGGHCCGGIYVFVAVVVVVVVLLYDYFLNVCSNKCRSSRLVKARAGFSERENLSPPLQDPTGGLPAAAGTSLRRACLDMRLDASSLAAARR